MPSTVTYRQQFAYFEDAYGRVRADFVISNSFDGLFAPDPIDVDIIEIGSTKHDVEDGEGRVVEDEIEFTMHEEWISTSADEAGFQFVLDAQNSTYYDGDALRYHIDDIRYCALFIRPAEQTTLQPADAEFIGMIRSEMKATDLQWRGSDWASNATPLRTWKASARTYTEGILEAVTLKDLIYGAGQSGQPGFVQGISTAWEALKVSDPIGTWREDADRFEYWRGLVSLNETIRCLATNLEVTLLQMFGLSYTITIDESPIGVRFSQAERANATLQYMTAPQIYQISADRKELALGDTVAPEYHPLIQYCRVKPLFGNPSVDVGYNAEYGISSVGVNATTYAWEAVESFPRLMYEIAFSLGMYVTFYATSATDIHVAFHARKSMVRDQVYLRDPAAAEVETAPVDGAEQERYYADAMGLATEGDERALGVNYYELGDNADSYIESDTTKAVRARGAKRLLFSIAPTLRYYGRILDDGLYLYDYYQFHGTVEAPPYRAGNPHRWDRKGATCSLFMVNVHAPDAVEQIAGARAVHPVAACTFEYEGNERTFYTLAEYIRILQRIDAGAYAHEYTLTVPAICGFRRSSDGTHSADDGGRGSWRNLALGCEMVIDGISYVVVGIERNIPSLETKIRLHASTRFAFSDATAQGTVRAMQVPRPAPHVPVPAKAHYQQYDAEEQIAQGDAVTLTSTGGVVRAIAANPHYGRVLGIAITDAQVGMPVIVQTHGVVSCPAYSWGIGMSVYLRTSSTLNLSQSVLAARSSTEDYFLRIGVAVAANAVELTRGQGFIYYPPIV